MPVPVDAVGRLMVVDPQQRTIVVEARGPRVEVGFPDLTTAREAYAAFTRHGGGNRAMVMLQRELQHADLLLEFQVRGVSVARLHGHSRGSWASRALHLGGTDISLLGVLRALLRR